MTDTMKINEFLRAARDWRILSEGAVAFFRTGSLADSSRFVAALAQIEGLGEHRFGIDIRSEGVTVRVVTLRDDFLGMTQRDAELAQRISAIAREQGLVSDPSVLQSVLIVPGAANRAEIMPFWEAVMGYVKRPDSPDEDLIDPHDRGMAVWVEEMEEARPGGLGAIHMGVWVPYEEAQKRVDAALAAGGSLVRDDYAPAWWTLADKYGNEVDIGTSAYRDGEPPLTD